MEVVETLLAMGDRDSHRSALLSSSWPHAAPAGVPDRFNASARSDGIAQASLGDDGRITSRL